MHNAEVWQSSSLSSNAQISGARLSLASIFTPDVKGDMCNCLQYVEDGLLPGFDSKTLLLNSAAVLLTAILFCQECSQLGRNLQANWAPSQFAMTINMLYVALSHVGCEDGVSLYH